MENCIYVKMKCMSVFVTKQSFYGKFMHIFYYVALKVEMFSKID